jgi:hypothetical protein
MTTSTTEAPQRLNLRKLITETVAFSGLTDFGEIADQVLKKIPEEQYRDAVEQMLRGFVQNTIALQRMSTNHAHPPVDLDDLGPTFISPEPELEPFNQHHDVPEMSDLVEQMDAPQEKPRVQPYRPVRSAKVARGREFWRQILESLYHVGGLVRKQYGDCGTEDLEFIVAERLEIAARNTSEADRHKRVRALVAEHKVSRVRDLPPDVLVAVFGRSAV